MDDMMSIMTTKAVSFWERVQVGPIDQCWEFDSARRNGYGMIHREGKLQYAHRYMWFVTEGYWPNICRHTCDNRGCVNPFHLEDGTRPDNIRDAVDRDRVAHGAALPQARLTESEVAVIRLRLASGELQRVIAADYGVRQQAISKIAVGRNWRRAP